MEVEPPDEQKCLTFRALLRLYHQECGSFGASDTDFVTVDVIVKSLLEFEETALCQCDMPLDAVHVEHSLEELNYERARGAFDRLADEHRKACEWLAENG